MLHHHYLFSPPNVVCNLMRLFLYSHVTLRPPQSPLSVCFLFVQMFSPNPPPLCTVIPTSSDDVFPACTAPCYPVAYIYYIYNGHFICATPARWIRTDPRRRLCLNKSVCSFRGGRTRSDSLITVVFMVRADVLYCKGPVYRGEGKLYEWERKGLEQSAL